MPAFLKAGTSWQAKKNDKVLFYGQVANANGSHDHKAHSQKIIGRTANFFNGSSWGDNLCVDLCKACARQCIKMEY